MKSLKEDFSLMSTLLIPVAVAINFTGSFIASSLKLPLFLDAIGTVFISQSYCRTMGGVGNCSNYEYCNRWI